MKDAFAPALGEAGDGRELIAEADGDQHAARLVTFAGDGDGERAVRRIGIGGVAIEPGDGRIFSDLRAPFGRDVGGQRAVLGEKAVRVAGEAIAALAAVDDEDVATSAGEHQCGREAGIAAADDDDVMHVCGPCGGRARRPRGC